MLIAKAPLRVSLGGGTDLQPACADAGGGFAVVLALDTYVYATAYNQLGVGPRITYMSPVPPGTGLGFSSAQKVAELLVKGFVGTRAELAEAAYAEEKRTAPNIGPCDAYAAAHGAAHCFRFEADGTVGVEPARVDATWLLEHLVLCYTRKRRVANAVLATRTTKGAQRLRDIGHLTHDLLAAKDLVGYGKLLTEQWKVKYLSNPAVTNSVVTECIETGLHEGALGARLVGAGAGGFVLFAVGDAAEFAARMRDMYPTLAVTAGQEAQLCRL